MRNQLPQDPSLLAQRPLPVVAAVPPQAVEYLLTCCIADPVLFRDTQRLLQPHHFNLAERPLAITWEILCEAATRNWAVTFELLSCQLLARAGMDYGLLTPDQMDMMLQPDPNGLFWSLTHPFTPITPQLTRYARSTLQQFLQERTIAAPLQRLASLSQGAGYVGDMTQILAATQQQQAKLTSLQALPVVSSTIVRGTLQKPALEFMPTGLRFVDEALGGDCRGDVNGLLGPTGGGKAQPLDAVVMTPYGPRRMGDMHVGASVCTPDGGISVVTGVYPQGDLDVYVVNFSDGSQTRCCGSHLWQVDAIMDGWSGRVLTTEALLASGLRSPAGRTRFSVRVSAPVAMYYRKVVLDPYLIGVLLGDGGLSGSTILVSTADNEILEAIDAAVPAGYYAKKKPQSKYDYRIVRRVRRSGQHPNVVKAELSRLGMMGKRSYEKEIPEDYLYTDIGSRWSLLQGLMDTDGSVMVYPGHDDRCRLEYCTTSEKLCWQIVWLVQSLGGLATVQSKQNPRRLAYRICVKFNDPAACFRLSRKKLRCRKRIKYFTKRVISSITKVGRQACQCIAIDHPDKLYLTDDFIVTHNTTMALHMAVSSAKLAHSQASRQNQVPPLVVYATYEQAAEARLRPMAWSVAYQIPRAKLMTIGNDWSQLTTKDNLEPYERSLFGGDPNYPADPPSETERWDCESTWLAKSFTFLDMSGCEEHPTAGNDGLAELVSYLDRLQSDRQQPIRSVYIDYAGLLISGAAASQGVKDEAAKRSMLKDLGMECRRRISQHFNCTTWLLHQMAGAAGKTSPTRLLTHNDAADCKSFAENMAVCGCLGTEDKQTGCRRLNWSKTRYNSSQVSPPSTLRIHDRFALMEDVSTIFSPDAARGAFMTAEDSRRIEGAAAAPRRQAGPRGLTVGNAAELTQVDQSGV